jgi:hypothetical protein
MNGSKQYISESNNIKNDNKLQLSCLSTIDETHEENNKQSSLISRPPSPSSIRDDADDECTSSEGNSDRVADSKEKDNSAEMSKVLDDMNSYKFCNTNILDNLDKINFASSMDRFVFKNLPLTNSQKEQLLLSMFSKV